MMAKVVDISASYRDNNAGRILLPQCFNRGVHGGPGRQAVVPQNNSAAANIGRRTTHSHANRGCRILSRMAIAALTAVNAKSDVTS
jgi:hypothetical protein